MKMENSLLPIGSVVAIREEGEIRLMILGYYPVDPENKKIFQYMGIPWPFGIADAFAAVLFDDDQISELVFRGYETAASRNLCRNLPVLKQRAERLESADRTKE